MIEIYGTEWCTYCKLAKTLCEARGVEYRYVDVDNTHSLEELEKRLGTKVRGVPQIFINNEYVVGGYTGLKNKLETI